MPQRGAGERRLQRRARAGASTGGAGVNRVLHRLRLSQSDGSCPTAACWSSARRPPACSWPMKSTARAGRVTLSVGEHVRLPRTYRGRDVLWWMDASGVWNQRYDEIDDLTRARKLPSPQLVGTPERDDAGSQRAQRGRRRDRRPAGRRARRPSAVLWRTAQSVRAGRPEDGSAARHVRRVGARLRARCRTSALRSASSPPARRPRRDSISTSRRGEIRSIVWATGFRPDYSWLDVPVVDRKGHLRHDGGVVDAPGLYAIGLPVLRRRKSTFIHGAEDDAREVVDHLAGYLAAQVRS